MHDIFSKHASIGYRAKQDRRNRGGRAAPPYFGRSVNHIPTRGADYVYHITTCPLPDFQTFLRSLLDTERKSQSQLASSALAVRPPPPRNRRRRANSRCWCRHRRTVATPPCLLPQVNYCCRSSILIIIGS